MAVPVLSPHSQSCGEMYTFIRYSSCISALFQPRAVNEDVSNNLCLLGSRSVLVTQEPKLDTAFKATVQDSQKVPYFCACVQSGFSQVCLFVTLWTVDCQTPLSMGIFQARILEGVAMPSSRGSCQLRDRTRISCSFLHCRQTHYH